LEKRIEEIQADLVLRIAAVRKKLRTAEILYGIVLVGVVGTTGFLTALLLEGTFRPGVLPRTILFWMLAAGLGLVILWFVGRPTLKLLGLLPAEPDAALALWIGKNFPGIRDRIVNALQLSADRDRSPQYYSPTLIDASLQDLHREIEPADFPSAITFTASRRMAKVLGMAATAGALFLVLFPSSFLGSAHRLWNHDEMFAAPALFRFIVEPGDREVIKGENIVVTVRVEGEQQKTIVLADRREGETADEEQTLELRPDGVFRYEFVALKSSTVYAVRAASVRSPEYRLSVIDRPVVKVLRLRLQFPGYSGLQPRQLDDNTGDVTALKGTRVSLLLEANKALSRARLCFGDSTTLPLQVRGNRATCDITLMKERTYRIELTDTDNIASADPIEYALRLLPDAYPTITVLVPGMNVDITNTASLPIMAKITDDYGFTRLRLAYRLAHSRYETPAETFTVNDIPLPKGIGVEGTVPYTWPLSRLRLVAEDMVQYYLEVSDNDAVSGPKAATSDIYTLRLPSLDEVFADVDKGHEQSLQAMREALQQAQEAKRDLEELRQDMKKEQVNPDWQDRKKAEDLLKKYEEIQKKMDDAGTTMDRMMNEMQKNQVLSRETLEKYQELQQMMDEMKSPALAEALKKLQHAMQQLSPEAMKQAMQQFTFSEENFRKSIERTMNLLKRIQIEQKLDAAAKRAEELAQRQEGLQQKTEQAARDNPKQLPDVARQQEDVGTDLQRLKQEMEDVQTKMEEFAGEMPLKEMQNARATLDSSGLEQQIHEIASQMRERQGEQATSGQRQAQQKMGQLNQQMQQVKKAMQQNQQRQIVNEMRRTLQDLLELSRRQEVLKNEAESLEPNSVRFRENAQQQMEVMRDLGNVTERLGALSQKTFSVSPEMGKSIGEAMQHMNDGMQSLDLRNGPVAAGHQSAAMGSLNEAAQQVQTSVNAMMQSGGQGMGMAGFMQRLQQLSGMQQGINQGTQNLGGLSTEQAAQMARLAGEQGAVRKSLEELAREASASGQLSKMLGDLRRVAEEMREVQTDLAQGTVNPETMKKQERILSRMLDSQRSARERDYENRRTAESGTNVVRPSPAAIDLSTREGKDRLRRDLLRALEEGYTRDYEELIKKYFEALEQ
jgi:hypothetical protein